MRTRRLLRPGAAALLLSLGAVTTPGLASPVRAAQRVVNVSPTGSVRSLRQALTMVARGGTIIVHPGVYRDTTIVISVPVTILGDRYPVLDGENVRQIMTVAADSVTVRGVAFRNVGVAFTEDLAAIKVVRARYCSISDNRIDNGGLLDLEVLADLRQRYGTRSE